MKYTESCACVWCGCAAEECECEAVEDGLELAEVTVLPRATPEWILSYQRYGRLYHSEL